MKNISQMVSNYNDDLLKYLIFKKKTFFVANLAITDQKFYARTFSSSMLML